MAQLYVDHKIGKEASKEERQIIAKTTWNDTRGIEHISRVGAIRAQRKINLEERITAFAVKYFPPSHVYNSTEIRDILATFCTSFGFDYVNKEGEDYAITDK